MSKRRKITGIVITLLLVFAMAVPTFAANQDDTGGATAAGAGTNKFAKNMNLQTVYIDRSKFYNSGNAPRGDADAYTLSVSGNSVYQKVNSGQVQINGPYGTVNEVKNFSGESWSYTYEDAAIFPDGSKGDVVLTYTLDKLALAGQGTNAGLIGKTGTELGLTNMGVQVGAYFLGTADTNLGSDTKVGYRYWVTLDVSVTNGSGTFLVPVSGVNAGKGTGGAFECMNSVRNLTTDEVKDLRRESAEVLNGSDIYAPTNSSILNFDDPTAWGGNNVRPASTNGNSGNDRNYNSGFVVEASGGPVIRLSTMAAKSGGNGTQDNTIFVEMGDLQHRIWSGSGPHGKIATDPTGTGTDLPGGSFTGPTPSGMPATNTATQQLMRYVVPDAKEGVTYTMIPDKGYTVKTVTVDGNALSVPEKPTPGDTWVIASTDGDGTLTYVGGGKFTYKFDNANTKDHEIYVTWKQKTADIVVSKKWNDNSKAAAAQVKLVSDAGFSDTAAVPASDGVVKKWEDMPVYNFDTNGDATTAIKYTLSEVSDPVSADYFAADWNGPDKEGGTADGGFTLTDPSLHNKVRETNDPYEATVTNHLKKDVEITKVWDDQNNKYGLRPTNTAAMFKLYSDANCTREVTGVTPTQSGSGNSITVKWEGVRAFDDSGNPITYYAKETVPGAYEANPASGIVKEDGTITNKLKVKDVTVTKIWDDQSDKFGLRPSDTAGMFKLYTDAQASAELANAPTPTQSGSGNTFTVTWKDVPATDAGGTAVTYYAKETIPKAYEANPATGIVKESETITNKLKVKDVTITKTWDDQDDKYGLRPSTIKDAFGLYTDAAATEAVADAPTPTEEKSGNNYTITWKDLPAVDANGDNVTYYAKEAPVPGAYEANPASGIVKEDGTITNKLKVKDVEITKSWDDQSDKFGLRPSDTAGMFKLYTDAQASAELADAPTPTQSGSGNTFTVTWKDVPATDAGGTAVTYYAKETIPAPYEATPATGIVKESETITNKLKVKDVTITKVWDDQSNKYNTRPTDISALFKLHKASDDAAMDVTPTVATAGANSNTYTWKDLPAVDEAGADISYYAKETAPVGYTSDPADGKVSEGGSIKNVLETKAVEIVKVWKDPDNSKRPAAEDMTESFTLYNKATGAKVDAACEVADDGEYYVRWYDLPKYDAGGEEVFYQAEETTVPANYQITEGAGKVDENGRIVNNLTTKDVRTVKRTIKYTYLTPDGVTAHTELVQELPAERDGLYNPDDPAADPDGWVWGEWNYPNGKTFPAAKNPAIPGWHSDDVVGAYTFDDPTEEIPVVHVVYQKDAPAPDPGKPGKVTPKTEDGANIQLAYALAILSLFTLGASRVARRKASGK